MLGSLRARRAPTLLAIAAAAALSVLGGSSPSAPPAAAAGVSAQEEAQLRHDDRGVYVAFCPAGQEIATIASLPRASIALASHAGWPRDECLKMDKGPAGLSHTLVGLAHVHNWLLGGYGNDTIVGGDAGDVIWGDYQPAGQLESESDHLHGGAGNDWIYASHGFNEIWTGAGDDHLLLVYGHGTVYCNGPGVKTFVMRYLPQNRPWKLVGCSHKVLVRYRA